MHLRRTIMKLYKNAMEGLVEDQYQKIANDENWCKCNICHADIVAKALNDLQPHYFVTQEGQLYTKLESLGAQYHADITAALIRAGEIVTKNPRH